MIAMRRAEIICVKVGALIVFACVVYFLREVVHEAYDPARQPPVVRSSQISGQPEGLFLAKSFLRSAAPRSMNSLAGGIREPVLYR